ncbi:YhgE/Pip family protein [Lederbergia wuyishanensis]|uniref:Membrane protein n=1 Tax=Lederbergia wuyishanensis TaxID=1347903 RepID=A0ABU0CYQ1_9BACI|nr:YhgE/Pip domain-containing protein [Lederbergia wuyishanensis]MCJ8005917.1 YhgE/Pip domain-containing protein [Lederbergia wuyishanensis]MDQ0341282.1 putative membrane protein [Lederbergia wuyishanensis]
MRNTLFIAEIKQILKNKKLLIPLIAVMLVPILYSGMFLWAFWDPYDRLSDLPVAVVNNDRGAVFEKKELRLGNELVNKLKESKDFNFKVVDSNQGYNDLENRKYYMLIEIPEQFSENATTLLDEHPKKLELKYIPNEGYNFLSAQIGETAIKEIKSAVSKEVVATYSETMFDKIKEMGNGLVQASDGAKDLFDGAGKLNSGSLTLKKGIDELAAKSIEFNGGVSKVQSGSDELAKGATTLADGIAQLKDGHGKLVDGAVAANKGVQSLLSGSTTLDKGLKSADQAMEDVISGAAQIQDKTELLADKLEEYETGAGDVAKGASELHAGIIQMQDKIANIDAQLAELPLPDEVKKQIGNQLKAGLEEGITKLEAGSGAVEKGTKSLQSSAKEFQVGASTLAEKMGELTEGQNQLKAGLGALSSGSGDLVKGIQTLESGQNQFLDGISLFDKKLSEVSQGANKLSTGASVLSGGMKELASGSTKISEGSNTLVGGSKELADGMKKLEDGSAEMKDKLGDASNQVNEIKSNDDTYDMMGEPIKVNKKAINKVPNYGTGFAPYFLSLGLFVGALLISIVFPLREPAILPKNGISWFLGKFGVLTTVGIIQSLLADAIMLFGLKIEVESVPFFFLTTIVTSLTFIALIQFLVTLLGDPGRFIAIIILILQLTTSAGTFPLELIPHPLQLFNSFLPMTYSVHAYKAVISSGDFSFMWNNLAILSVFIIGFMIMTIGFFQYKYRRQYSLLNSQI